MRVIKLCAYLTILLMTTALITPTASAQTVFGAGVGGGSCSNVTRLISRDWLQLKGFFGVGKEKQMRPKSKDFFCVSPYYVRDAVKKNAVSFTLKCFTLQTRNFCCDSKLTECASI